MNDILIAKNLVKEYKDEQVVRNVSISIRYGEFSVIVGPSGSGKTTLLNLLSGLDKPTAGKITLDVIEITGLNEDGLALLRRKKVGFIFQTFYLIPTLTALKNIELPLYPNGVSKNEMEKRGYELIELMGMKDKANHFPGMLSGGEKQRVAIARALINEPKIVFADEPTGNLDSNTGGEVIKLLKRLNRERNMSFLIVTHNEGILSEADRTFRMRDGRLQ